MDRHAAKWRLAMTEVIQPSFAGLDPAISRDTCDRAGCGT